MLLNIISFIVQRFIKISINHTFHICSIILITYYWSSCFCTLVAMLHIFPVAVPSISVKTIFTFKFKRGIVFQPHASHHCYQVLDVLVLKFLFVTIKNFCCLRCSRNAQSDIPTRLRSFPGRMFMKQRRNSFKHYVQLQLCLPIWQKSSKEQWKWFQGNSARSSFEWAMGSMWELIFDNKPEPRLAASNKW